MNKHKRSNLTFRAGEKALAIIRDEGLSPDRVKVVAGAAGGPKWLVLSGLDRALFSTWFKNRTRPLFLIGSSIGAWRFAAASRENPGAAIDRFESAYIHQSFTSKPTPEEVTSESKKVMDAFLGEAGVKEILQHPRMRLNIMTARCKGPVSSENKYIQALGLIGAFLANFVNRRLLRLFFQRSLFYHPGEIPPFFHMDEFPIRKTPLDEG
ncbi:MAG: patatin-like phospholipase family protein, partial [Desulfobacterales bacterium]|nr:patatin-like phospholipase family protein [Desulfobacterales bacterium]